MRIIVDTNVVMSGVFFSGTPSRILKAFDEGKFEVYANTDIVAEYEEVYARPKQKLQRTPQTDFFHAFTDKLKLIKTKNHVTICRDPDDDKFISCALDAKALYIVSGDNDLLDIQTIEGIAIVTAADFYEKHLSTAKTSQNQKFLQ